MSTITPTSFYVIGGTLQRNAPSYVPRRAEYLRVIVDDGNTGILVPPRDANRLAAAMRSLLDDPAAAAAMGARARAAVLLQYSLEAGAARWSAVYQQLVRA